VKDIVCEIYKILDLIRDSANVLEVEAGILLDNCDLNNYEISKMKVLRTSFIIEYIDIKIYDNPALSNPSDNPTVVTVSCFNNYLHKNIKELISFNNISKINKTLFGFSIICGKSNKIINFVFADNQKGEQFI
jgi:hypothetical protein